MVTWWWVAGARSWPDNMSFIDLADGVEQVCAGMTLRFWARWPGILIPRSSARPVERLL